MISISGIIGYLGLFLGLCLLIVVVIASYNIISKSYKPTNALLILIPIYLVLLISSFFTIINFISLIADLQDQDYNTLVTF